MSHYYNEIDPYCAAWLQNLMDGGHIPAGVIDTRSIEDVRPDELRGFTQCHFFAGIAGWPLALRLAGWPESRRVWTGSCPCQPFSAAGKGAGFDDERHLWPAWQHLIAQCRPTVVFGEQVASKAVDAWIDLVHADMEGMGYGFGAIAFPAAGIGAPHIRDRTYWVGHADRAQLERYAGHDGAAGRQESRGPVAEAGVSVRLADTEQRGDRREAEAAHYIGAQADRPADQRGGHSGASMRLGHASRAASERDAGSFSGTQAQVDSARVVDGSFDKRSEHAGDSFLRLADTHRDGCVAGSSSSTSTRHWHSSRSACGDDRQAATGPTNGQWANADWLGCTDGKWRPVEPGTQPLLDGLSACVERLRAIEIHARKEIDDYATASQAHPDEVLRILRQTISAQQSRQEARPRVLQQLHAPEILLAFLQCIKPAHRTISNRGGIQKESTEEQRRFMQCLRLLRKHGCSSYRLEPAEQFTEQSSGPLLNVSLVLARHASAYGAELRNAHAASGRVGMLRAYGNAIIPQQAAEFIGAYLDVERSAVAA